MKKIRYAIQRANEFDKICIAELFGLMQNGRTEFVKGRVCVEVRTRKGEETYTIWRLSKDNEYYEVEVPQTKDKSIIAKHLYDICDYESLNWEVPFESAKQVMLCLN